MRWQRWVPADTLLTMATPDGPHPMEPPVDLTAAPPTDDSVASPEGSRMPAWVPRVILLVVVAVFASYFAFIVFRKLRDLIFWLVTALFLSFALEPAVNWLVRKHGWRRGVATGVVLFGLALIVILMIAAMVPLIVNQVQELVHRVPGWLDKASRYLSTLLKREVDLSSSKIVSKITSADQGLGRIASNLASVGAFILSLVFQMLTIGLFTFYLVADGPRLRRSLCSLLTPRHQREVLDAWEIAIDKTGGFLYSRLLLAAISALFSFVALTLLGVPFALPLALWMGFVSQFIPVIGTYIAAAVPLLVALMSDPWSALIFLIYVIVYQQVENYLFSPRITARTMQLHPAVAFFAALAGASVSGVLGAFMALPAAAVIQATVSSYVTRHEVVETDLTRQPESTDDPREAHRPNHRKLWSRLRRGSSRKG
jgi:predicted PurR-regulated permease PerM